MSVEREIEIEIHRLSPERVDDFLAFFDGPAFADNPDWADCYCWFPCHDAADGDFDERGAAANRAAMAQAIRAGRAEGYLAYTGGAVIGWVNAAPRAWFPQLAGLPGDSESIGATPCFTVDPAWRRRGIARRLLEAAIEGLRADDMMRMEAGPYTAPQNDAHRYHGTIERYESAGFERVADLPGGVTLVQRELQVRRRLGAVRAAWPTGRASSPPASTR